MENDEKISDLENALAESKKAMERFEELSVAESKKVHRSLEVQSEDVVALDGRINSRKAEIRKAVSNIDFLCERLEAMERQVDVLDEANREKAVKIAELEKRVCRCGEKEVVVGSKSSPIVVEETEDSELEYLDNDSFQTAPEVRSAMADGVLVPIEDEEHNKENVLCDRPATCSCRRVRYEILDESSESVSTPATSVPLENTSPIPIPYHAAVESAETSSGSTRVVGLQRCVPSRNHLKDKRFSPYPVCRSSVASNDGYRGSVERSPSPNCVGKGSAAYHRDRSE